jgi:chaperonin cofactor prefoldin
MKALHTILIGLFLIGGAVTKSHAQTPDKIAALEQRIATLELQNRSLKTALETLAGRTLTELLTDTGIPAVNQPSVAPLPVPPARKDTSALEAALKALQSQIEAAEADIAAWDADTRPDPFAERKMRMSKVDAEKGRAVKQASLSRLKAQQSTLRAQILAP